MRRLITMIVLVLAVSLVWVGPVAGAPAFPDEIPIPDGFYPEGIAVGHGDDFYVGSLFDGAIYKGDLRSGEGEVIAPGAEGRLVAGLAFDRRSGLLWGVGFDQGTPAILAFDGSTGTLVHQVTVEDAAFLNDIVVTRDALYVTDSMAEVLWTVPLNNRGAPDGPADAIELSGDFVFVAEEDVDEGELAINLNGIDATPDGGALIAVHTALGVLYRIDPTTGVATEVELDGDPLEFGDGIVLHGTTLYVVQNFPNQVAVVELAPDLLVGTVADTITSDLFMEPTTAALFGSGLYLINSRFADAFPPFLGGEEVSLPYHVVRVCR